MAAKWGFRQHLMFILMIDLFILLIIGFPEGSSTSIFVDFISDKVPFLDSTTGIFFFVLTLLAGISLIGVTTQSNFAGVQGILSSGLSLVKRGAGFAVVGTPIAALITDYVVVYLMIVNGTQNTILNVIATIIFFPLIIDAIFASVDWIRGVNT